MKKPYDFLIRKPGCWRQAPKRPTMTRGPLRELAASVVHRPAEKVNFVRYPKLVCTNGGFEDRRHRDFILVSIQFTHTGPL